MENSNAVTALTPGQKAALTRAQNQGRTPRPASPAKAERAEGLGLALIVTESDKTLSVTFEATKRGQEASRFDLPDGETSFPLATITAWCTDGKLVGFGDVRIGSSVTVGQLAHDLPALTKLEKAIRLNAEEGEGAASFAETVFTLAHHTRASEVRIVSRDGKSQTVKRGAPALMATLKLGEAFVAKHTKPAKAA